MAKDEKTGGKRSRKERNKLKVKPPTKIIIRHLPPTMTEEEFLKQIDPLPEHDFYYFSAADWSLGFDATCRAYITFKNYDDVFLFRDRFDGYVFVDNKGNEYAAIVEFAPFQGFLKNKSRNSDNKVNTIEQEPHYEQFLQKLEEEREAASKGGESKLEFTLETKKEEITSTPLLQYLASKKEKRREESKKRTAEKKKRREEEKEKRKQTPTPAANQPVKVLTADNNNKSEKLEPKGAQAKEEPKNARLRRREERNRLRHEAYLQRKKALKDQQSNKDGGDTPSSEKDDSIQTKKEDSQGTKDSSPDSQKPIEILKKAKPADMLTESVRNFIFSAATSLSGTAANSDSQSGDAKEKSNSKNKEDSEKLQKNSPKAELNAESKEGSKLGSGEQEKSKGKQRETSSKANTNKSNEDLDKLEDNISKLDLNLESNDGTARDYKQESRSHEKLTEKQREERREERRIRNKDRPSIAIYQPKPRIRVSEESDSNSTSTKDVRSQSVSDCEASTKKEEPPRQKKVQRYSERSKNRRKSLTKEGGAAGEEEPKEV